MRWQRNISQMKVQDKIPEQQIKIGNLPEKVFRVMAVKMMQDLRKRVEAQIKKTQVMV